jgi:hypothetical protein
VQIKAHHARLDLFSSGKYAGCCPASRRAALAPARLHDGTSRDSTLRGGALDRVASTRASPLTKQLDSTRRLAREVVGAACRARRRKTAAPRLLRALSGAANPGLGVGVRTIQDARKLVPAEINLTARRPASRVTRPRCRRPILRHGGAARPRARANRRAGVTSSAGVRMAAVRVRGSPAQQLHNTTARSQIRKARRRDAMRWPSPRHGLGLGTLGCARARTHALNHKKKLTAARRPETQNSRLGATLASRSGDASRAPEDYSSRP